MGNTYGRHAISAPVRITVPLTSSASAAELLLSFVKWLGV